jgi:high affinity Mn2+ porin
VGSPADDRVSARRGSIRIGLLAGASLWAAANSSLAADPAQGSTPDQVWAIHAQATFVEQGHPAFTAPYSGTNSLSPDANGRETFDLTGFLGFRPWKGAEIWFNPEVDQGFGLSDTLGVAGFPSAEAYKVGMADPYVRVQRLFIRQTIDLGGAVETVDPDQNQLGGRHSGDRLVITFGKFSATDIFDANDYAHDPKHDFLNWGMADALTFDYAADAWGYTYGLVGEWYQGPWTLRAGLFDLSTVPNSAQLDNTFQQFQWIAEVERRYTLAGRAGALKVTGFLSRGRMGTFADAIALSEQTGEPAATALVRSYRGRGGVSFNLQQQITGALGLFVRGGLANGNVEPFAFSDADSTVSGGVSLNGKAWGRPRDVAGLGAEVNGVSRIHQSYFNDGGLGILVGDGKLPHPGPERILETYYAVPLGRFVVVSADYQFVDNPAYNKDRGPASVLAARFHVQF